MNDAALDSWSGISDVTRLLLSFTRNWKDVAIRETLLFQIIVILLPGLLLHAVDNAWIGLAISIGWCWPTYVISLFLAAHWTEQFSDRDPTADESVSLDLLSIRLVEQVGVLLASTLMYSLVVATLGPWFAWPWISLHFSLSIWQGATRTRNHARLRALFGRRWIYFLGFGAPFALIHALSPNLFVAHGLVGMILPFASLLTRRCGGLGYRLRQPASYLRLPYVDLAHACGDVLIRSILAKAR